MQITFIKIYLNFLKFHYQTKHHGTCAMEIQRKSMSLMFIVVVNSYETFYFDYNVYWKSKLKIIPILIVSRQFSPVCTLWVVVSSRESSEILVILGHHWIFILMLQPVVDAGASFISSMFSKLVFWGVTLLMQWRVEKRCCVMRAGHCCVWWEGLVQVFVDAMLPAMTVRNNHQKEK